MMWNSPRASFFTEIVGKGGFWDPFGHSRVTARFRPARGHDSDTRYWLARDKAAIPGRMR